MIRQEARFERFTGGWNPHNLPPTYLNPRELGAGQLLDARNLRFTAGGSLFWDRNQLRIAGPASVNVKTLVDFTTDDYSQLLAFCKNGAAAELHYLSTDWPALGNPTQWAYGYEVFAAGGWTEVTGDAAALAELETFGIAAAAQARERLLICPAAGNAVLEWDGATLRIVGLDPPLAAPTEGTTSAGQLPAGTYSYYYTFWDPVSGYESMPSPILDVHVTDTTGTKILLEDIVGAYPKRLYRAYSEETGADARGAAFYFLTQLGPGSSDAAVEALNLWTEVDVTGDRLLVSGAGNERVTATALQENEAAYIYSDETAVAAGDIDFRFEVNVTSQDDGSEVIVFGLAANVGVGSDWTNGGVKVQAWRTGSSYYLGDKVAGNKVLIATGTSYYCRLVFETVYVHGLPRYGRLYLKVHLSSDYSDTPQTVQIVSGSTASLRYVYAICAAGGTGVGAFSGYVENIILGGATTFTDDTPEWGLGDAIAFDHALPPRGSILSWHKDCMWMAGSDEGSRSYPGYDDGFWGNVLFRSVLDDPRYWPGANNIVVGDDGRITGLASWGEFLVVWKTTGLWTVSGWDNDDIIVTQQPELPGCVGYGAYCAAPVGVVWLAPDGYYFWNGAEARQLVEISDETPWAVVAASVGGPMIAYHDGRFVMQQASGRIEWEPATDRFTYHEATCADGDGQYAGMVAVRRGPKQTHLLTRQLWVTGGDQEITVLDPTHKFANHAGEGSSYSDLYAPVSVTLPPLDAPPGYTIVPLELWVAGSWTDHAEDAKHVFAYLNDDADYSATAGQNAWATTPDAPQEGEVLGVPVSFVYGGGTGKTNAARRWYIQLKGLYAKDFKLEAVTVRYLLRRAGG